MRCLRASEERCRLISRVNSDYVFSSEVSPEGALRLDWVAGAFEPMTGYTIDDYVAAGGWRAHLDPADAARDAEDLAVLRRDQPLVTTAGVVGHIEKEAVSGNGEMVEASAGQGSTFCFPLGTAPGGAE